MKGPQHGPPVIRPPHLHPKSPGTIEVLLRHGPATLTATVANVADLRRFAEQGRHVMRELAAEQSASPDNLALLILADAMRHDWHLRDQGTAEHMLRMALSLADPAELHDEAKQVVLDIPTSPDPPSGWTLRVRPPKESTT